MLIGSSAHQLRHRCAARLVPSRSTRHGISSGLRRKVYAFMRMTEMEISTIDIDIDTRLIISLHDIVHDIVYGNTKVLSVRRLV